MDNTALKADFADVDQQSFDDICYSAKEFAKVCKDNNWSSIQDGDFNLADTALFAAKESHDAYGHEYPDVHREDYIAIYKAKFIGDVKGQDWFVEYEKEQQNPTLSDEEIEETVQAIGF